MPTRSIEERLAALEHKVAGILRCQPQQQCSHSWLEDWFGTFKDNPDFDSAMDRAADFRRSQPIEPSLSDTGVPA